MTAILEHADTLRETTFITKEERKEILIRALRKSKRGRKDMFKDSDVSMKYDELVKLKAKLGTVLFKSMKKPITVDKLDTP